VLTRATITVPTDDGPMDLFEARPDEHLPVHGGIVVAQEAFGVNDHIEDVTCRIAELGYHAIAPTFFHRAGGGTVPYGDFEKVMEKYAGLDDDAILMDLDATFHVFEQAEIPLAQVGVVGFCFGGRVSFLASLRRAIGAGVGFYGGGIVNARFPQFPALAPEAKDLQAPWLGFFGDEDPSIPVDDVEALRAALVEAPVETKIVRYADAGHGFFRDVSKEAYREDAAHDAWEQFQDWLLRHLLPG
jgi:carboxymethylenebutenolidase